MAADITSPPETANDLLNAILVQAAQRKRDGFRPTSVRLGIGRAAPFAGLAALTGFGDRIAGLRVDWTDGDDLQVI